MRKLSKLAVTGHVPLVACLAVAAAALAGCAAPPAQSPAVPTAEAPAQAAAPAPTGAKPPVAPDPAVLGVWKIEQARAAPLLHKLNARLDFGPGGRLAGNGGCNGITSSYTLAGNRLTLGPLATTRKTCTDALMEQEDRVLTALERAVTARVPPHGLLELLDADGTVLLRGSRLPPASSAAAPPVLQ
jgi:heat shock protein HslJ